MSIGKLRFHSYIKKIAHLSVTYEEDIKTDRLQPYFTYDEDIKTDRLQICCCNGPLVR